jgi:hypothetical protein
VLKLGIQKPEVSLASGLKSGQFNRKRNLTKYVTSAQNKKGTSRASAVVPFLFLRNF